MTRIDELESHIKELDKELEDIYNKLGFFRKTRSYAEKSKLREKKEATGG